MKKEIERLTTRTETNRKQLKELSVRIDKLQKLTLKGGSNPSAPRGLGRSRS